MLGQPVFLLTPDVIGVELTGRLAEGITATDLVLAVTEMLRREKVVGKFVEFFGEGTASLTVTDRATIANMAPEYGATMGFFPVDENTVTYMRNTGRSDQACELFEGYFRAQNLFGIPRKGEIDYTRAQPGSGFHRRLAGRPQTSAGPHRAAGNALRLRSNVLGPRLGERLQSEFRGPRKTLRQRHRRRGLGQWRRPHRSDYLVHQHLQPGSHDCSRASGAESGRAGTSGQAAYQDLACTGLARRHPLP